MSDDAYGIDFGTTNTILALSRGLHVEAVALDKEQRGDWSSLGMDKVVPSVIGFDGDEMRFGWKAKRQAENKLEAVKRMFATDDTVVVAGRELPVEVAGAAFFRHVQGAAAEAGLLSRLDRAVVTIPANSRGKARYRTKLSAGLAGIEVLALINEPTAAAMAHARTIGQNQRVLVFDWGGGTLDVTVLQAWEGTFIEQASKGIQRLGGIDIDKALFAALAPRIPGSSSWKEYEKNNFMLELELAKIKLSAVEATQVPVPGSEFIDLTRAQLEEAIMPLVLRTREPLDTCLRDSPGRIDHLVMVGGSSKMPVIQRFVTGIVGTEPTHSVDPMTAVAEGAAIAAGILQGTITDLDFHVGTEHALGTVVHNDGAPKDGRFSVLIRRNTKYPARATDSYSPAADFQDAVNIKVIEGDPDKPIGHEDNVILKDWSVQLPEQRLKADSVFTITYEYDLDGILHVELVDVRTGRVMMKEEVAFGAAEDRSQLQGMRRRVDTLMADSPRVGASSAAYGLSAESRTAIEQARTKVIPFVPDMDRQTLEALVAALESAGPQEERALLENLRRELRNHAYLL